MWLAIATCLLVGVPVVAGDCDVAQRYAPHVRAIPLAHWWLVQGVEIRDQPQAFYWPDTRLVTLTLVVNGHSVAHETAHAWAASEGGEVQTAWNARFWPNGQPVGPLPPYAAGKRMRGESWQVAAREDLAEAYAILVCRDYYLDPARRAWLVERAPELGAVTTRCY